MSTAPDEFDSLVAKLRNSPEERRIAALEALREIVGEPYRLSPDELAILSPALGDVRADRNMSEAEHEDLLTSPWV